MKKLLLLATILVLAFTGCKKDDGKAKSLIGTWATDDVVEQLCHKYNADGTGEDWIVYNGKKEKPDTYKYNYDSKKNTITYTYSDEVLVANIIEFSDNKLTLKHDGETFIYHKQ